jgi:hypothetical protein
MSKRLQFSTNMAKLCQLYWSYSVARLSALETRHLDVVDEKDKHLGYNMRHRANTRIRQNQEVRMKEWNFHRAHAINGRVPGVREE